MDRSAAEILGAVETPVHSAERAVRELAARQHGLVTRSQMLKAGLGPDAIQYRLSAGRLERVHRGVYRLGPLVAPRGAEMAAVLACGPRSAVSHRSAAAMRRLCPERPAGSPVDVSIRGHHRRRRPGIRMWVAPDLAAADVTTVEGIPTTTVERTLVDLTGTVAGRTLKRAVARAARAGLLHPERLRETIARSRRRGVGRLEALLARDEEPALTRSEAEERFLALVRSGGLPRPRVNVGVGGHEVDFLWSAERVIAEVDGYAYHFSRHSFEGDRRRDGELQALGFTVVRVTWRQLTEEPEATLVRLAMTLAAGGV